MSWKLRETHEKKEVRKAYGETLKDMLQQDAKIIICDSDLASSSGAGELYHTYPEHTVNFGICEANMIAGGAGISMTGLKPFVHSFAPFVSRRVADQICISLAFAKTDMHIYASDPGYWSLYNGATHTTFEDIAMMRAIPNLHVVAPSDAISFAWVLRYYQEHGGIYYNRCTRKPIPMIYTDESEFTFGKGMQLKQGTDICLIAIGEAVYDAMLASELLDGMGISTSVVDMLFIKPFDTELIQHMIHSHRIIVTIENHSQYGGIGELIGCEMAKSNSHSSLVMMNIGDRFGEVGTEDYLKKLYHLSVDDIVEKASEAYQKSVQN